MRPGLILVVVLVTGCGQRSASLKVAVGGVAVASLGVLLLSAAGSGDEPPPKFVGTCTVLFVGGGLTTILAGLDAIFLFGGPVIASDPAPTPTPNREASARQAARERAWSITKASALAARRGDCAHVRAADATVASLDPDFHVTVFRRDVAIARCLGE